MRNTNSTSLMATIVLSSVLSLGAFAPVFAQGPEALEVPKNEVGAPVISTRPGVERPQEHPTYKQLMAPVDPKETPWDKIKMTDSKGKNFTADKFRGKIVLVNFFFSHCPDVCPPQTAGLHKVIKGLAPDVEKSVMFLSITIDPDNDTGKKLEEYRKQFGIATPSWTFARTTKPNLAKIGEHFGSLSGDPKKPLDHKARLYLVNADGSYLLSYDSSIIDVPRLTKDLTDAVHTFVKKAGDKEPKAETATTVAPAAPEAPAKP